MNNEELFESMCDKAGLFFDTGYPTTKFLFGQIMENFKTAGEAITDIQKWIVVNQYTAEWSIDMILLGYYMRTTIGKGWDTKAKNWKVI